MAINEFTFDPSQQLSPALPSPLNRLAPAAYGPSLTITRGQAQGRKTSDGKFYPLVPTASDGTQTFAGFAQYGGFTDASGNFTPAFGGTTNTAFFGISTKYSNIWTGGVFDPRELTTSATGTAVSEVDTFTPAGTITTGDVNTITLPNGAVVSFTVGGTTTAAAVVTGLTAAWNANSYAASLGTPSGSGTFIVTATTPGKPLGLTSAVAGVGTLTKVVTTAAVAASAAEKDTFTIGGTIVAGDIYTATITFGNTSTRTVTYTATGTTAASVTAGLLAAWNADGTALRYATPTNPTGPTFVLTGVNPGQSLNVTLSSSGAGTVSKAVTTLASGTNLADILSGAPGSRILQPSGFWEVP